MAGICSSGRFQLFVLLGMLLLLLTSDIGSPSSASPGSGADAGTPTIVRASPSPPLLLSCAL
ncbi:hypothetical protein EON62_02300 [archaeon]|nr:MAG: hypothetical protein EON62_02300 [archaeon]